MAALFSPQLPRIKDDSTASSSSSGSYKYVDEFKESHLPIATTKEPQPHPTVSDTTSTINITAAVCHKTLFGNIDLKSIGKWARYHYLLGFDRIFIGYLSDVQDLPGFAQLRETPYITMYENKVGKLKLYKNSEDDTTGYLRIERPGPGDQNWDIRHCLRVIGKPYDLVQI